MTADLLAVARRAIEEKVLGEALSPLLAIPDLRPRGCFVSLQLQGDLRGCLGTMGPTKATLLEEIQANAIAAATDDPRFPPLTPEELTEVLLSLDLLGPLRRVAGAPDLEPARMGLKVSQDRKSGVLLPGLPGINSASQQLNACCLKAGIETREGLILEVFTVERFQEPPRQA